MAKRISSSRPSRSSRASPSIAISTMNGARTHWLSVGGIDAEIIRKDIKNLYMSVRPPDGLVRVSTPLYMDDDAVRLALVSRLDWIRKKQRLFQESTRQTQREMVSGESHYFRGKRYRLKVEGHDSPSRIFVDGEYLKMSVRLGTDGGEREKALNDWSRQHVKEQIPVLVRKWEPV